MIDTVAKWIEMKRGPMPPVSADLPALPTTRSAGGETTVPGVVADPPPAPPPSTPAIDVAPAPGTSPSDVGSCSENLPSAGDLEVSDSTPEPVRELRRTYERLGRELRAARAALPTLAAAVQQARHLARERNIESKILPETARLVQEARDLLARAAEAEAIAAQEVDALTTAHKRIETKLEAAVAAAAAEDEHLVREFVLSTTEVERVDAALLDAIDALFLRCRLRGLHGSVQHMVSSTLQLKLDGGALMARSSERFRRILAQVNGKAVAP